MGTFLDHDDLAPLAPTLSRAVADIYIEDVEAQAQAEAPCIFDPDFAHEAQVRAILRQAILRWHRAGEGGLSSDQNTTGPFTHTQSFDTRVYGEGRLLSGEVRRLRSLCRARVVGGRRQAFTVAPR